jgi:hypothetical protein
MTLATLLLIAAFILFILASCGVNSGRVNLIAAGLACVTLSLLAPGLN